MHGLTGGSWKRHTDRTRATEMKDTRGNLAVTSGSETYRRCALPRQLSTLLAQYLQKLDPALVAPVAAFLTHQDCSVSGEIYTVGAGHVARFFIGRTKGFYRSGLSIEDVRDHLGEIRDEAGYTVPGGPADEMSELFATVVNWSD